MSNNQSAPTPVIQRGFVPTPSTGQPLYRPSSPLSPPNPRGNLSLNRQDVKRPVATMRLSGLPKYHPANFMSQDTSPASPLSTRILRPVISQSRSSRGSDAHQRLQQYRRDQLAQATDASPSHRSAFGSKPSPPRLTPLRSPVEPMTPLHLERQPDYLFSGSNSLADSDAVDGREMVERLVRRENERRAHPEARSGDCSPTLSPAVSPAGGPR